LLLLVKKGLRRCPYHRVVSQWVARLPYRHPGLRQCGAQTLQPRFWLGVGAAKGDAAWRHDHSQLNSFLLNKYKGFGRFFN
jgi:hypothetical protein